MDRKYNLLVIDDNEELLGALSSFFRSRGHAVATARDGLEGLRQIENETEKFDLMITDLVMPHVSKECSMYRFTSLRMSSKESFSSPSTFRNIF